MNLDKNVNANTTKDLVEGQLLGANEMLSNGFVTKINSRIATSMQSWLQISSVLAEAKGTLSSENFTELLNMIPLSQPSIYKLVEIGDCEWMAGRKDERAILDMYESWATDPEVIKQSEAAQREFVAAHLKGVEACHFTSDEVEGFYDVQSRVSYTSISVRFDNNSVDLDSEQFNTFYNGIASLPTIEGLTVSLRNNGKEFKTMAELIAQDQSATAASLEPNGI